MSLDIELPSIKTFLPRCASEHYGANFVAAAYCGLTASRLPPQHGHWGHSWVPRYLAADRETSSEYLKLHFIRNGREDFWCPIVEGEEVISSFGYRARAVGLPIVYLPPRSLRRIPGSLLVMPVHSQEWTKHTWNCEAYADSISQIRNHFSQVFVCVSPSCIRHGYWVKEFEGRGFQILEGAHYTDANALSRVQALLSQFEYMTTNGFGSHIAYGAYFGAKVSIHGPFAEPKVEEQTNDGGYLPGNRFLERYMEAISEQRLRLEYPFLFCHPTEALDLVEWSRAEVGADRKVSPAAMRELFRWLDADIRRWNLYGRSVQRVRKVLQSILPGAVKGAVKTALSSQYRSQQREIARLKKS
jgi:hypothetical protein